MRLISPLLKHAVYPTLQRAGWLGRMTPPDGYAVVNYHGVLPSDYQSEESFLDGNLVSAAALRAQLRFLKSHYRVIAPEEFRSCIELGRPIPRSVLVTCDDGLLNTLSEMLPVLQEEGVACLFFVTSASCREDVAMLWYEELYRLMRKKALSANLTELLPRDEGPHAVETFQAKWWNIVRRASRLDADSRARWMDRVRNECGPPTLRNEQRWRLLNAGELRELADAGMSIGAHTRTHPVLSLAAEEESQREIQNCKLEIEWVLGKPVWAFAYPFGNPGTMGDREFHFAREAGYTCAFLNVEHWPGQGSNPLALSRTHVTADMSLAEFAAHLSGVHARLRRAVGA